LDAKIDRLEKDLREYRRLVEENPPNRQETSGLYTEENLSLIIHEITEKKDLKVTNIYEQL